MSHPTLFSVAHAGGQGKTTFAQILYLFTKRNGLDYSLAAADFMDATHRSKFGKLYPNHVTELGIGAQINAARIENDPNAAVRYWDRVGEILLRGSTIVDLGANVITGLVDWATDRRFAQVMDRMKIPPVEFFIVARAERHGTDHVCSLVRSLTEKKIFGYPRIVIVKNEVGGSFTDTLLEDTLAQQFPDEIFTYVRMSNCTSEIWPALERHGVSIETALAFDEEQAMKELGLDIWSASSGLYELQTWSEAMMKQLQDTRLLERDEALARRLDAIKAVRPREPQRNSNVTRLETHTQ